MSLCTLVINMQAEIDKDCPSFAARSYLLKLRGTMSSLSIPEGEFGRHATQHSYEISSRSLRHTEEPGSGRDSIGQSSSA